MTGKAAKYLGSQACAAPAVAGQYGWLYARGSIALDGRAHAVHKDSHWPGVRVVLRPGRFVDGRRSELLDDIVNGVRLKSCAHRVPKFPSTGTNDRCTSRSRPQ